MVKALREVSVDAMILTTNDHGPDQDLNISTGRWIERDGVPILAFPRWRPPFRALREYAFSPALSGWLDDHIHDYHLLHVHALFSYPSTSAMAQARSSPRALYSTSHWPAQSLEPCPKLWLGSS